MLVDTIKHMESYVTFRDVIIQNFYFSTINYKCNV